MDSMSSPTRCREIGAHTCEKIVTPESWSAYLNPARSAGTRSKSSWIFVGSTAYISTLQETALTFRDPHVRSWYADNLSQNREPRRDVNCLQTVEGTGQRHLRFSLHQQKTGTAPGRVGLEAELHPTKGYANRRGWHGTFRPSAPHLSTRNRAWFVVRSQGVSIVTRPRSQGGKWFIADSIKIVRKLKRLKPRGEQR